MTRWKKNKSKQVIFSMSQVEMTHKHFLPIFFELIEIVKELIMITKNKITKIIILIFYRR